MEENIEITMEASNAAFLLENMLHRHIAYLRECGGKPYTFTAEQIATLKVVVRVFDGYSGVENLEDLLQTLK